MRRAILALCILTLPAAVAIGHRDPRGDSPVTGRYSFRLDAVDITFTPGAQERRPPDHVYVFGHVQAWIDTHGDRVDFVFGPVPYRPEPRFEDPQDREDDTVSLDNKLVLQHTDCTPPENAHVRSEIVLLPSKRSVPRRLRAPKGKVVDKSRRGQIERTLAKGIALPDANAQVDPETEGDGPVAQADGARYDVGLDGQFDYTALGDPCTGGGTTGTPTNTGTTGTTGTPSGPTAIAVENAGYEHPSPPAASPPYSGVCGDVELTPPEAGLTGTAKLQVEGPPGTWTDYGAPKPFTTGADGKVTVKFGISDANRSYRIVATAGDVTATSDSVNVGPGTAGTGTRDCYPPS